MRRVVIAALAVLPLCAALPRLYSLSEEIPALIVSPGVVGTVEFPHRLHFEDMGIECRECHHETAAAALSIPHEEYYSELWVNCQACHGSSESAATARACSNCHPSLPATVADETLSAKVVIHRSCWTCHEVGTGVSASTGCAVCHVDAATSHGGGPGD